ncbi:hypothetical protein ACH5RR_015659 [Cinchona calisaya]|uniref:Uncharacterized protein n=1 Tax=Cinchona calisaya TaxID=153742 RepID=A0ABD2ZX67_9GENT
MPDAIQPKKKNEKGKQVKQLCQKKQVKQPEQVIPELNQLMDNQQEGNEASSQQVNTVRKPLDEPGTSGVKPINAENRVSVSAPVNDPAARVSVQEPP